MIIFYYCMAFFVFIFFANKKYVVANSVVVFILTLIVINYSIIYGIRTDGLGTDTKYYVSAFEKIQQVEPGWEVGFINYMKSLSYFGVSSTSFIFITCIISITLLAIYSYLIVDDEKKYSIAILFVILSSFSTLDILINGIRQGLGICVFYFGFSLYFIKLKKISFFVLICACLIHNSIYILLALFVLSIYCVKLLKNTKCFTVIALLSAFLTVILGIDLKEEFFQVINNLSFSKNLIILKRLSNYEDFDFGLYSKLSIIAKILMIVPLMIPILSHILFNSQERNEKYKVTYILYCMILTLYFLLLYQPASYRYTYLFAPILPVIYFYNLLYTNKIKLTKNVCVFITLIFSVIYASKLIWVDVLMK